MNNKQFFVEQIATSLRASEEKIRREWQNPVGTSTRHFILDNLLPTETCLEIYEAFPRNGNGFFSRDSFREKKKTSANLREYDPLLSEITYAMQEQRIVSLVADLVGLQSIEPDPKLYAGGLSMMFKGDFLNPHLDNSHDSSRQRYRRLNLLYYVSPEWQPEFGGNLELWDEKREKPVVIAARHNRLVVMETNKSSWHSVSPVTVDRPRCCVSNYYFSSFSPDNTEYFHVTSFTGRPTERVKRALSSIDNGARNFFSKTFKFGRGKRLINSDNSEKNK